MDNVKSTPTQYLCNPDVVLREEDENGGLLFNPDTNQVKVVNITALFIWKQFAEAKTTESVASLILKSFQDAAPDVVRSDLKEFMDEMLQSGFLGEVEPIN